MCGIYGAVGRAPEFAAGDFAARMGEALKHRGPDGDGHAVEGATLLGCRRLAIMDVVGGRQPLTNETGEITAVCNGEIYNYPALRTALVRRGHVFRTHSDAEVLPHLYEEYGAELVHHLEGMFALAVWDRPRRRLVLARDRLGEKPLYFATPHAALLFASEPKALLASGLLSREPDWVGLSTYLRTGYVPAPHSAFAQIHKLPPAGRLVVEGETLRQDRYWEAAPLFAAAPLPLDRHAAATAVREQLEHAVHASLMSDVPLGVFLSGGLDSTAITAIAQRELGDLNTFALGFPARSFDEREFAAHAAHTLGTRHHTLTITPESFLEGVHAFVPFLDEPLADAALIPTFLLARFARTEVKVVLVGEGSDELFAGYPTYWGARLAAQYAHLPVALRRWLAALAPHLGAPEGNTTVRFMLRRFLEEAEMPPVARHQSWMGCFGNDLFARLLHPSGPLVEPSPPVSPMGRTAVDSLLAHDVTGYLADDLLPKLDRATMAASLEGRAPFVNHHLVELAARLPIAWKLRGLGTKRILRDAVADVVPKKIQRRLKRGLTVPLAAWLAGPLQPFARETLARLDARLVRREMVDDLLREHVERRRDNRRALWALIMFQLWKDACGS